MKSFGFLAALVALLVCHPAALPAQAAELTALRGTWTLDRTSSDRPNAPAGRREPDGPPPGAEGFGGFPESSFDPTEVMALIRPAPSLTISVVDLVVTVAPERGLRLVVVPGGATAVDTLLDGRVRTTRARWSRNRLVIERELKDLAKVKDSYRVDPDTGRLLLDSDVSPKGFPRTITTHLVYLRQPEAR